MASLHHPNVIVFLTDQQRWDTTGVHGNPLDLTPNFDRFASFGTHLHTTCTCQPVCAPARSVLQTGRYATNTGVFRNGIVLDPNMTTLAGYFRAAGYTTGYIGKWHLASGDPTPRGEQGGYEYWLGSNALEHTSDTYRTVMYDADGREHFLPGYRVDAVADAAIRWIAEPREQPFFLFLSFLEPHHQNHLDDYPPPDGYRERYTGRWVPPDLQALGGSAAQHLGGYFGMVKRLDEAFGRLLDALKSMGLIEETIVLYTSDHGNHFKTRNGEYKRSGHEASIRVPTALGGPGFEGGGTVRRLVSLVDLPPTLLDGAGIEVPASFEGRSVVPLLHGGSAGWQDDLFMQISEAEVGRAVRTMRWKYGVVAPGLDGNSRPDADSYDEAYLYDLAADPYELTNLLGLESHRAVSERMRARLLKRIEAVEGKKPKIHVAPSRPGGQRKVSQKEVDS